MVRLALDDGHRVDPERITFGDGINVVSIADTVAAERDYVATERLQQFSVNALDAATGAIIARGPVTGGGPGGVRITVGPSGTWLSYATGSLGQSVRIDPVTLTGGVTIDDNARPSALPGADLLWVDSTWAGIIGCADPTTGALWRQLVGNNTAISFAVGIDGHTNAYNAWAPIEPPALCKDH